MHEISDGALMLIDDAYEEVSRQLELAARAKNMRALEIVEPGRRSGPEVWALHRHYQVPDATTSVNAAALASRLSPFATSISR
jgi:hypothetical protein